MDNKEYLNAERAASWREALRKSKPNKDRINISRTEMNELTPDYRITCNEEVNQGLTREQALIEASRCLDCPDPLCITRRMRPCMPAGETVRIEMFLFAETQKTTCRHRIPRTFCSRLRTGKRANIHSGNTVP